SKKTHDHSFSNNPEFPTRRQALRRANRGMVQRMSWRPDRLGLLSLVRQQRPTAQAYDRLGYLHCPKQKLPLIWGTFRNGEDDSMNDEDDSTIEIVCQDRGYQSGPPETWSYRSGLSPSMLHAIIRLRLSRESGRESRLSPVIRPGRRRLIALAGSR